MPKKSSDPVKNPKAVLEIGVIQNSLVKQLGGLKDTRVERKKKHQLTDLLVISRLAIIGGAGWEDIENYGINKQTWLKYFLALPNGISSDDTFRRYLSA
jgi:hypothetical protein